MEIQILGPDWAFFFGEYKFQYHRPILVTDPHNSGLGFNSIQFNDDQLIIVVGYSRTFPILISIFDFALGQKYFSVLWVFEISRGKLSFRTNGPMRFIVNCGIKVTSVGVMIYSR
jgi:hypothetical protein